MIRPPATFPTDAQAHPSAYPLGELFSSSTEEYLMALLALSHTPLEDQLYRAMLREAATAGRSHGAFSVRRLTNLTGINSSSTIRRALSGLLRKKSIQNAKAADDGREQLGQTYQIFSPREIFERRHAAGLAPYPKGIKVYERSTGFERAIERVASHTNLSRREAQVALACAEGMTNAEIGERLSVSEQTVKFHLRNIFNKFGVRRRTELIARLLAREAVLNK